MQTRDPTTVLSGRYALQEELGRSGTGMAWRAEDRLLRRTVTVKLIHPNLGDDPAFARRLAEEARRVVALSSPGLVPLLDTGVEDGVPYLVREHVEGMSVRSRLRLGGPLAPAEAARIAIAVLEALAPAHDAGVLHLHVDTDDVLLTPDGGVRLTDLGIGQVVADTRPPAEAVELLGGALAPELSEEGPADARADLFQVGAVLFETVTGEPPGGRRSPREVRPSVPRALDRVVARALATDPDERFESAAGLVAALRSAAAEDRTGDGGHRGVLGAWLGVPLAIAVVAAAAIAAGLWLGRIELGGPLGIRPAEDSPSPAAAAPPTTLRPTSVAVFDPFGTLGENDASAPLAIDGDEATSWRSENYFDGRLNKPGVGLVFDLGDRRDVVGFRMRTPHPGFTFQVAVGDDPQVLLDGVGSSYTALADTRGELSASGRYVLVWITSVVPVEDGHRAEVGEFDVVVAPRA